MKTIEWEYDEVAWGDTLCIERCIRPAELLMDGIPYCIHCADLLIERQIAIAQNPTVRDMLPPVFER